MRRSQHAARETVSPAIARFLARLPPALAASFTQEQLAAIELHFAMRYRHGHRIDWRLRLRLPFLSPQTRAYLVVLAGADRPHH